MSSMMTRTHYLESYNQRHRDGVVRVQQTLTERGYGCRVIKANRYNRLPDIQFHAHIPLEANNYVAVKTRTNESPTDYTIAVETYNALRAVELDEGRRVYLVSTHTSDSRSWYVDTLATVEVSGPRRHTWRGSNDDWYRVRSSRSPFDAFFDLRLFRA
jgi:hypothetical protein